MPSLARREVALGLLLAALGAPAQLAAEVDAGPSLGPPLPAALPVLPAPPARAEPRLASDQAAAERALAEERAALEAAQRTSTEARRLIEEEHARLLEIGRRQTELEARLVELQRELAERGEAELALRRRVQTALGEDDAPHADELYDQVHDALRDAREELGVALARLGAERSPVPTVGPNVLSRLPVEVDQSEVGAARARVIERAAKLRAAERDLARAAAKQLMAEVDTTNRSRLALLPALSADKRERVLGFAPAGWEQAASEVEQVALTLRYHAHSAYEWQRTLRERDVSRHAAWLTGEVALQALLALAVFWWWRRRAESFLRGARQRVQEERRRRRDLLLRASRLERAVIFIERVRRPLEWLLLVQTLLAILPPGVRALLEVRLLGSILTWILGGVLVALSLDALSSEEIRGVRGRSDATRTGALRLETLRLVAYAAVAFGLVLSLSDLLVGQGTIYAWVYSSRWFVALPVLLTIISWWRPIIFERLGRLEQPTPFQSWVLARQSGAGSFVAAALGGVYLFGQGALRSARTWFVTFTLTRRLLAYLFRRDLSKHAHKGSARRYAELPRSTFDALGPEALPELVLPSAADRSAELLGAQIAGPSGALVAIVGERGSGKSTFLTRLWQQHPASVRVPCHAGGLDTFRRALNEALLLPAHTQLEDIAGRLAGVSGPTRLLIDDAHHLIRPEMGGLREFDRLLQVCRECSGRSAWVFAFDHGVWRFLDAARETGALFDEVVWMSAWREEGIVRLLTERSKTLHLDPNFEHLIADLMEDAHALDRREALQRTEANYYRLLWDYASGNPGVALHFWRRSLGLDEAGTVRVRLFDAPEAEDLESLSDSTVFVLRAILQLGWASLDDIARVTALPRDRVADALRLGGRRGFFDHAGGRYRVTWDWFRAVSRLLERRHLLASGLRGG